MKRGARRERPFQFSMERQGLIVLPALKTEVSPVLPAISFTPTFCAVTEYLRPENVATPFTAATLVGEPVDVTPLPVFTST